MYLSQNYSFIVFENVLLRHFAIFLRLNHFFFWEEGILDYIVNFSLDFL